MGVEKPKIKIVETQMEINFSTINRIVAILNGKELSKRGAPRGLFFRVKDFEFSYHKLSSQFYSEYSAAEALLGKSLNPEDLSKKLKCFWEKGTVL